MVEKIILAESKGIDFDINGHIYNVNFDEKSQMIKFQKVRKEFLDWQKKDDFTPEDIEEGVNKIKKIINTILGDDKAVETCLSESQRNNIRILSDLALQLFTKTLNSQNEFKQERVASEYAPE